MDCARRLTWAAMLCALALGNCPALADTTTIEDSGGVRWQVTRRNVQMPVTSTTAQSQTVYRQQYATQTVQHQQVYNVPVTQYQLVSRLHGRWNPFVTPYWTHHYEPVTSWQQQTANVQIPVTTLAWVPETRTVQSPTTTYQTVVAESRVPLQVLPGGAQSQQMLASAGGASSTPASSGPTAVLAARPGATAPSAPSAPRVASAPASATPLVAAAPQPAPAPQGYGGQALSSDPPRQGWQAAPTPDRYR
jgi:hypothetical protein